MGKLLELLRIITIMVIIGGLGWIPIAGIYTVDEKIESYSWLGGLAILLLLFILYRNKLQFSGWYKGKDKTKLPKSVTYILTSVSLLLFFLPFLIGLVLS